MNTRQRLLSLSAALLFALVVIGGLAGCATGDGRDTPPAWVDGIDERYTNDRYLTGVGQADTLDTAKDRARADLAKNFKVAIEDVSTDTQRFSSGDGGQDGKLAQDVSRDLVTRTDQVLRGAQVAEIWQDDKSQRYYALAAIERTKAARGLRDELANLDADVGKYVSAARDTDDLLQRVAYARRAAATHAERDELNTMLRTVERIGHGSDSPYTTGALEADLAALANRINVQVQASDEPGEDARDMLSAALTKAGFSSTLERDANYVLSGAVKLNDAKRIQGNNWVMGAMAITLRDALTGQVRGTKQWEVKAASGVDAELAHARAIEQAQAILNRELASTISGFAELKR